MLGFSLFQLLGLVIWNHWNSHRQEKGESRYHNSGVRNKHVAVSDAIQVISYEKAERNPTLNAYKYKQTHGLEVSREPFCGKVMGLHFMAKEAHSC